MRLRLRNDEPCTSKPPGSPPSPGPKQSPTSPVARIAKRNARLLNEFDLNTRVSSYSEHHLGTMPEFTVRGIHEFCSALTPATTGGLEAEGAIDNLLLGELQFQLEKLLAENLDWQRNIHGERTFLQTGDYPIDDPKSRPMPVYELRSGGRQSKRKSEPDEQQPSCSYADSKADDEDAASDVISSMDERDHDEQPYCVLDIPHRFWTWVREYVGHVDEKFLREFNQNFCERYRPENMIEFFVNEPFKYKAAASPKTKTPAKPQMNGVIKEEVPSRRSHRHSAANGLVHQLNGVHPPFPDEQPKRGKPISTKIQVPDPMEVVAMMQTPEHTAELMKRLVAAYVLEKSTVDERLPPKRKRLQLSVKKLSSRRTSKSGRLRIPTAKMRGTMNGRLNGTTETIDDILTDDEDDQQMPELSDQLLEVLGTALADCVLPAPCNGVDTTKTADSESEMSIDQNDYEETNAEDAGLSNNMENYELINLNLGPKNGMNLNDLDEVSLELLKAQQRLESLVQKTTPALDKCKRELEAEHAHWMTSRALNMVDDELFHLSNKLPTAAQPPPELYKKCLQLWELRKRRLLEHHVRDHVKLAKLMENLRLPTERSTPASMQRTSKSNRSNAANRRQ